VGKGGSSTGSVHSLVARGGDGSSGTTRERDQGCPGTGPPVTVGCGTTPANQQPAASSEAHREQGATAAVVAPGQVLSDANSSQKSFTS